MTFVNGKLYIAGTDPCCNDDWTKGNVYTYIPGSTIITHRTMQNVLHTLGLYVDPLDNTIYAATGAHIGDNKTWVGQVFKSIDQGVSWSNPVTLSDYRVWDIIGFNGKLYAIAVGTWNDSRLVESIDNGANWKALGEWNQIHNKPRFIIYKDRLIAAGGYLNSLVTIDKSDKIISHLLPGAIIPNPTWYNIFAVDNQNYLYMIAQGNRIIRTNDLTTWYEVSTISTNNKLISLAYWPEKNLLVVTDQGENSKIWSIDLAKVTDLPVIPTPDGSTIQKVYQGSETGGYSAGYPSLSFDGRYLVFSGSKYHSSNYSSYYNLFIKELKTGIVRKLLSNDEKNNQIAYPLFSPDGKSVYFSKRVNDRFKIFKIDITSGVVNTILNPSGSTGDYMLGSISPDGGKLLYVLHGAGTESGNEDVFETITGVPHDIASSGGNPKPS